MILLYILLIAGVLIATILPGYERARAKQRQRTGELDAAVRNAFERSE
jgi:hypothetical protein